MTRREQEHPADITVSGVHFHWDLERGVCLGEDHPVALMWVDSTLAGLMSGVQAMVGTARFSLALQSEGRKSVAQDWQVISRFPDFRQGFEVIAGVAAAAGWGKWTLEELDESAPSFRVRVSESWEGRYQRALSVCWGSAMLAGKMAGYATQLFGQNCWAEQTLFSAAGDPCDEFVVRPSTRVVEREIGVLLQEEGASRADMTLALRKLEAEVEQRVQAELALRKENEKTLTLLRNASDGIHIVDASGHVIEASDSFCAMLGYRRDEILGMHVSQWDAHFDADEIPRVIARQLHHPGRSQFDTLHRCKDGRLIEVEVSGMPVQMEGQTVLFNSSRDITERKVAERALRESEQRFRALFDLSPDPVWILEGHRFVDANLAAARMFGYASSADFLDCHPAILSTPFQPDGEESGAKAERMMRIAEAEGMHRFEWKYRRRDGSEFYGEVTLSAITLQDRPALHAVVRDISPNKQMERSLAEFNRDFEAFLEQTPDFIYFKDARGHFRFCSQALARITGHAHWREMVGKHDLQVFPPETAQSYFESELTVLREGRPLLDKVEYYHDADGERRYVVTNKWPLFDADGQVSGLFGISRDITEQKQAEDELRDYRLHLEQLVESRTRDLQRASQNLSDTHFAMDRAGIGIHWVDAETGRLVYANDYAADMLGYRVEELLTQSVPDIDPNFPAGQFSERLKPLFADGVAHFESTQRGKDGRLVPVDIIGYWMPAQDDRPGRIITFISDITRRKAIEQELIQAREAAEAASLAKSTFLANMSHEIRSPMNGVLTMAETLADSDLDPDQRVQVQHILQAGRSLTTILNDVLDFSRIEAGQMLIQPEPFDLRELVDGVAVLMRPLARDKDLDLRSEVDAGIDTALIGDPARIRQVLINLVGNAVKFTPRGSVTIRVGLQAQDEPCCLVRFSVEDTGIGLDDTDRERVFERFVQVEQGFARRHGGSGLGLGISKGIVELMDGRIGVDSQQGLGSTFWFELRLPVAAAAPSEGDAGAATTAFVPRHILVVDDDPINRYGCRLLLEKAGHRVALAENGQAALDRLDQETFDLVLMDVHMPEMDGLEATRRIRRHPEARVSRLPVVGLTASVMVSERAQYLASGMNEVLPKPIETQRLNQVIREQVKP